jgi:RNAse (barnase) inhibitor barstar
MDNKTTKYVIDFKNVKGHFDMFEIISTAMEFPDYFGNNWDAFWDCLTDMRGRPIHIEILGIDVLQQKCGEKAAIMVEALRELKHYNNDKYAHEIKIEIVDGDRRVEIK